MIRIQVATKDKSSIKLLFLKLKFLENKENKENKSKRS